MAVVAFKSRRSDLRNILKVLKHHFDDLSTLRRYEPSIQRLLFMGSPQDKPWSGEALHWLALMHDADGNKEEAEKHYVRSMSTFADHEWLGLARVMRDYGLFVARTRDLEFGLMQIRQALALHDEDLKVAKGQNQQLKGERQRRITESYVWRARLLVDSNDTRALNSLVEFALTGCQDCCHRDQQQAVEFVIPYADGMQRPLLNARLIEINARRRKLSGVVLSMAKLVIGTEIIVAKKIVRILIRKE